MAIETISSHEARTKWRDVLDKVLTRTADVVIERSGKPVAVLIPVEDERLIILVLEIAPRGGAYQNTLTLISFYDIIRLRAHLTYLVDLPCLSCQLFILQA